jgi:hypothetical protein
MRSRVQRDSGSFIVRREAQSRLRDVVRREIVTRSTPILQLLVTADVTLPKRSLCGPARAAAAALAAADASTGCSWLRGCIILPHCNAAAGGACGLDGGEAVCAVSIAGAGDGVAVAGRIAGLRVPRSRRDLVGDGGGMSGALARGLCTAEAGGEAVPRRGGGGGGGGK